MIDPALLARYRVRLDAAIAQASGNGARVTLRAPEDGARIWAEPQGEGVAWGVDDPKTGEALLRGRRLWDGSDVAP